jgi:hypothetical protein
MLPAALLFLLVASARAGGADGYVVKIESGAVYLDLGEKTGAASGQPFFVYSENEPLVAEGRLTLVLPSYSVGSLLHGAPPVAKGMRARLGKPSAPAAAGAPAAKAADDAVAARQPRWKSPGFDFAIAGMAVADFRGDGKPLLALADRKTVSLHAYPPVDTRPLAQYVHPGAGPRILSLSAADVDGNGRAELFVTLYNESFSRAETVVLEWADGRWRELADTPWLMRGYQDGSGRTQIAMQQLLEDQSFPFSGIYRAAYRDGKYVPGEPVRFKHVEFLYDFTQATLPGEAGAALLIETANDNVRVQLANGFWKTPDGYGQTPARVRWHSRLLEFHPQIPIAYKDGRAAGFYLVRNLSALGAVADPFGLFNGGLLERHAWTGVALAPQWRAELGGYSTAAQLVPDAARAAELVVAVTGAAGKSAVWIFEP